MRISKDQIKKFLFWYCNIILLISICVWAWQIFDVVPQMLKSGISKNDILNHYIFILNPFMPYTPVMYFFIIYMVILLFSIVFKYNYGDYIDKIVFSGVLVTIWQIIIIFLWSNYKG